MLFRHVVIIDDLGDSATINVCVVIKIQNSIPTTIHTVQDLTIHNPWSKIFDIFSFFFFLEELSVCCVVLCVCCVCCQSTTAGKSAFRH
jgi:hypothetical protein